MKDYLSYKHIKTQFKDKILKNLICRESLNYVPTPVKKT